MKKFLSLILALTFLLSCVPTVIADNDISERDRLIETAKKCIDSYSMFLTLFNDTFSEGEAPDTYTLITYFTSDIINRFEKYAAEEDGETSSYNIPAEIFESLVGEEFVLTDVLIDSLRSSEYFISDSGDPYYHIPYVGGFGIGEPIMIFLQDTEITSNGNLLCRAYDVSIGEYVGENGEEYFEYYVPGENEVEGVDYLRVPYIEYDFDPETDRSTSILSYIPGKIIGGYECTMKDEGGVWKYLSYSRIDKANIPFERPLKYAINENDRERIYFGSGYVDICPAYLPEGATVSCQKFGLDELPSEIASAITEKGNFWAVTDYTISADGEKFTDVSTLPVTVPAPYYARDVRMYYLSDAGEVTEIEGNFDIRNGVFYTEFRLSGKIATVYDPLFTGDANVDGKINLKDAGAIMKNVAGWDEYANSYASDVNGDGKVNLKDASTLLKFVAGWNVPGCNDSLVPAYAE